MANSTDTLGEKGESEKRSGFWLAFCLVGCWQVRSEFRRIGCSASERRPNATSGLVGSVGTVEIISARGA